MQLSNKLPKKLYIFLTQNCFRFESWATTSPVNGVRLTMEPEPSDGFPPIMSHRSIRWRSTHGITDPFPGTQPSTFSVPESTDRFSSGSQNPHPDNGQFHYGTRAGSTTIEFSSATIPITLWRPSPDSEPWPSWFITTPCTPTAWSRSCSIRHRSEINRRSLHSVQVTSCLHNNNNINNISNLFSL